MSIYKSETVGVHAALLRSDTRYQAHEQIKPQKARLQRIILEHLSIFGSRTCEEIEEALGMAHQTISPRVGELRDKGLILSCGERKTRSGRRASLWRLRGSL